MDLFRILYREDPLRDVENEDYYLEGIPAMVTKYMNKALIFVPSIEEINGVAFSFSLDKASGPDGFSASFYQNFCEVIKKYLCRMVGYSFKTFIMGGGINTSFLALIPKESNPSSFSIFRPISLCNVSYKIF